MRFVYAFAEGSKEQTDLLGGKGANLAEMGRIGLPVPPGFTITTQACRAYLEQAGQRGLSDRLLEEVHDHLGGLERQMGRRLGDPDDPLLVSVRSGAPVSMPGMMDTVLNLGLNDASASGLAGQTGDERFAFDGHRRFVQMFGAIVQGVDEQRFEEALQKAVQDAGVRDESELDPPALRALIEGFRKIVVEACGEETPEDPHEQLRRAIEAVFSSWNGERARNYRRMEGIPDDLGTAVTVQAMVFGNAGSDSATGVAFTRDPSTGENRPYGDWLPNAQGEDVVAGIRVTQDLGDLAER
ncbi:MAG: pyruvate, phosphate dikinase, partial [Nitriliruptorales bacterium]|nr:pyruvate, phosphate dikinase [Nitriliruptorales bacterium]